MDSEIVFRFKEASSEETLKHTEGNLSLLLPSSESSHCSVVAFKSFGRQCGVVERAGALESDRAISIQSLNLLLK